jgi:hypothetical protein
MRYGGTDVIMRINIKSRFSHAFLEKRIDVFDRDARCS